MGSYLNPNAMAFKKSLNSQIFVDKSMLIAETNKKINSEQQFMCVSRPRRFGKSMAMKMLAAYYSYGTDSQTLFDSLKISGDPSYKKHINQYNVIWVNMQNFVSMTKTVDEALALLESELLEELQEYCDTRKTKLQLAMMDVYSRTGVQFVILIDEWDCLFREYKENKEEQKKYLDFLRLWMKDQDYVALAYMTGILPIKKYGTHSAPNMFTEYSMTNSGALSPYFGFTEEEVRDLCETYRMSSEEAGAWYDGYELTNSLPDGNRIYRMYNPKSVVESMLAHRFDTYWNKTETYEALQVYILLNIDGLKDRILRMMAGERVPVDTGTFVNDMTTFARADDVLTLLIHLGYLTYCPEDGTAAVPNREVSIEYANAVSTSSWSEVAKSVENSRKLLKALWEENGEAVAAGIAQAHEEISILQYNDENSLSCCIILAFYFAKEYYTVIREFPAGKGFADIVFVPRTLFADKPAAVIELKVDKSAKGAIDQIKEKNYCGALKNYTGKILLCGISYDRATKEHTCVNLIPISEVSFKIPI